MKRFLILACFSILIAHTVTAAELSQGYYAAETTADLVYTGDGWVQLVDGDYVVMESTQQADEVAFQFTGGQLVIYRDLLAEGAAAMELCIDAVCTTITSSGSGDQRSVPVAFSVDNADAMHDVTLTNMDGGIFRLDAILIIAGEGLDATTAPSPTLHFVQIGDHTAAVDWTISGGDVVTIAFLFAVFTVLLAQIGVQLWKA